jgi:hypothetical protein
MSDKKTSKQINDYFNDVKRAIKKCATDLPQTYELRKINRYYDYSKRYQCNLNDHVHIYPDTDDVVEFIIKNTNLPDSKGVKSYTKGRVILFDYFESSYDHEAEWNSGLL